MCTPNGVHSTSFFFIKPHSVQNLVKKFQDVFIGICAYSHFLLFL